MLSLSFLRSGWRQLQAFKKTKVGKQQHSPLHVVGIVLEIFLRLVRRLPAVLQQNALLHAAVLCVSRTARNRSQRPAVEKQHSPFGAVLERLGLVDHDVVLRRQRAVAEPASHTDCGAAPLESVHAGQQRRRPPSKHSPANVQTAMTYARQQHKRRRATKQCGRERE